VVGAGDTLVGVVSTGYHKVQDTAEIKLLDLMQDHAFEGKKEN
jgi:hypothetical protein